MSLKDRLPGIGRREATPVGFVEIARFKPSPLVEVPGQLVANQLGLREHYSIGMRQFRDRDEGLRLDIFERLVDVWTPDGTVSGSRLHVRMWNPEEIRLLAATEDGNAEDALMEVRGESGILVFRRRGFLTEFYSTNEDYRRDSPTVSIPIGRIVTPPTRNNQ